ncbi:hypothetical protein D3C73_1142810 [compost metagenome]
MQLAVLRHDLAVLHGNQSIPDPPFARRNVHAHHGGKGRTTAGFKQPGHERAVQRLGRFQHDLRVGNVAGQDALGQDQKPRAACVGALHQVNADLRVFFPDSADGELAQSNFQHGFSFMERGVSRISYCRANLPLT